MDKEFYRITASLVVNSKLFPALKRGKRPVEPREVAALAAAVQIGAIPASRAKKILNDAVKNG